MPSLNCPAIICSVRTHGEHGAIVRLMTRDHGLQAGYVRGGRSRSMRPILMAGNLVQANLRFRTEDQLAGLDAELRVSRGPWLSEPQAAAAINWVSALTASCLPEGQAYPDIYEALAALLDAICHAPSARGWAGALVRYEMLMLERLGFALDLSTCAACGGSADLAFVSPKSGQAVSKGSAVGYEAKLLPLPIFLLNGSRPDWPDIFDGLKLTGFFIEQHFFQNWRSGILAAREQMVHRLVRMAA